MPLKILHAGEVSRGHVQEVRCHGNYLCVTEVWLLWFHLEMQNHPSPLHGLLLQCSGGPACIAWLQPVMLLVQVRIGQSCLSRSEGKSALPSRERNTFYFYFFFFFLSKAHHPKNKKKRGNLSEMLGHPRDLQHLGGCCLVI